MGAMLQQVAQAKQAKDSIRGNTLDKMQGSQKNKKQGTNLNELADYIQGSGWMSDAQKSGPMMQQQPQQQNWASGITKPLEGVGQKIGQVREGIFDFAGVPEEAREGIRSGAFRRSQPLQPMPRRPVQGAQTSGGSNDAVIQTFNQTMQALKQKRGF